MSIKERIEKAKKQLEKTERKAKHALVSVAALLTSLTGAVSCGEANVKDNDKEKDKIEQIIPVNQFEPFTKEEVGDILLTKTIYNSDGSAQAYGETKDGEKLVKYRPPKEYPLRKHADNPNDPDSLLVQLKRKVEWDSEKNHVDTKAKYVAIAPEDKDKEFVEEVSIKESDRSEKKEDTYKTTTVSYDGEGRHAPERVKTGSKTVGGKYTETVSIKYKEKGKGR